jgi:hypothetical protein
MTVDETIRHFLEKKGRVDRAKEMVERYNLEGNTEVLEFKLRNGHYKQSERVEELIESLKGRGH